MRIIMGSDHGGFALKEELKRRLTEAGYDVVDDGCYDLQPVDYPDVAVKVAKHVLAEEGSFGVLCCGTGIGISIAANKVPGIRAALLTDVFSARMSKEHNDANIICFGGRTVGIEHAWEIMNAYLKAEHLGGIHARRVNQINAIHD